jgi:SAM-dependent methyltransferase
METMKKRMGVKGIDIDPDMVSMCSSRGLDAVKGSAELIPFDDDSFDVCYCSFLLLWAKEPAKVVKEMVRVSRNWVICLAEPDFGGRISHPIALDGLNELIVKGLRADGADPFIGRKLREIFRKCGIDAEIGVHPGTWGIDRLRKESEDEWRWVEMTLGKVAQESEIERYRCIWQDSLDKGMLFQFNPIFYALGRK